jgi:hypothetical protein
MKTEEAEMRLRRQALEPEQTPPDEIHERRIAAARACRAWQEIDGEKLIRRDHYLVDPDTDEAYEPYRGDALSPGAVAVADMTPLVFFVEGNRLVFLERQSESWSEILYQRERRAAGSR